MVGAQGSRPDVLGEQGHRFALRGPRGLVHDGLQPYEFGLDERPRQDVQTRRVNRGLEDGVAGAIETDELAPHAAMRFGHVDSRTRWSVVDRAHLQLSPRAAVFEYD